MPGYLGFLKPKASRDLVGKQLRHQRRSVDAGVTQCRQRRREVALGEAAAILVGDKGVMKIGRLGQAEQQLQQALDGGRGAEVGAAYDRRNPARRVVDHAAQVIRGWRVLAGQDRVADVGNG